VTSPALPSYRTTAQQVFFRLRSDGTPEGTTIADGDRWRAGMQAQYYVGSFGLFGEQIHSHQEVRRAATTGALETTAWGLTGSYILTGERATGRGIAPRRPFDPSAGAWGAFEVAARCHTLSVDEGAFPLFVDPSTAPRRTRAWTTGVNWYLTRGVRLTVDYEQTFFTGGAEGGDRRAARDVLTRLQLAF
jgi:phosphate-selective porin OprO/OprP